MVGFIHIVIPAFTHVAEGLDPDRQFLFLQRQCHSQLVILKLRRCVKSGKVVGACRWEALHAEAFQGVEIDKFEDAGVGGFELDARSDALLVSLDPAAQTQAPKVAWL